MAGTRPFSSRMRSSRDLLRRVRLVARLDGRLRLGDRAGELGEVVGALGLVERPALRRPRRPTRSRSRRSRPTSSASSWSACAASNGMTSTRRSKPLAAEQRVLLVAVERRRRRRPRARVGCCDSLLGERHATSRREEALRDRAPTSPVPPRMNALRGDRARRSRPRRRRRSRRRVRMSAFRPAAMDECP